MIVMSRAPEASGQGRATESHDEVFDAPREFLRVRGLISDKLPPTAASPEERRYARSLCRLVERKGYTGDLRLHRVFELWVYCGCHPAAWHRNPDEDEDLWNEYKASELFHYMVGPIDANQQRIDTSAFRSLPSWIHRYPGSQITAMEDRI
ncbi:uncharacterized protein N7473_010385 [Penicillium subrubescens]|uniref:uncharacterized protein n=1 Tax=Penicillium subrubescens TaxID=1316194 RepID=UPI002544FC1C|nr:uncharacterized protein N7473_010385 [Penicillium subrubescens]KAJ5883499.1 hypothetical protein N7473_010385 [Penicillium subrubescens]